MPDFRIIPYHRDYQAAFYDLNRRWIEKHYQLEDQDKRFLADPERYIINTGGMVFFLLEADHVAGTCGIMRMDDETYELVRMAVDFAYRGKGYGEMLVNHASLWAKAAGAKQIILETGSALKPAIKLYERIGFEHYEPKQQHRSGLERANVFMRRAV